MIKLEELPVVALTSMNDMHLEEIQIINRLEAAAASSDLQAIETLLHELISHTDAHLSHEERMMEEKGFPVYAGHKAEHDRHRHELESVLTYFKEHQDPRAVSAYIEGSLSPWLLHHAKTMDTLTAQFLASKS